MVADVADDRSSCLWLRGSEPSAASWRQAVHASEHERWRTGHASQVAGELANYSNSMKISVAEFKNHQSESKSANSD